MTERSIENLAAHVERMASHLASSIEALGDQQRSCAKHGEFTATGQRLHPSGREIWTRCPTCIAESDAQVEAERRQRAIDQARAVMESRLEQTAIPARFIGKTLDNFNADSEPQRYALTVARDYAENFEARAKKGEGLILSGMPGTGKSHLAGGILQALLPERVGFYTTCMGILRRVRGTWRKDSEQSEAEVLRLYRTVDLLVIDEIGVQYGTDGEQTILFDVIDGRYREMQPTILLTNQDRAGFKTFIGERAYDRLTETSRWIPFDWPSYRLQARKEGA
jgi:DNA replication protein DnaC